MIKRTFGKTGWDVAAIGQGCWNIGNQWGELTEEAAEAIIHAALDHGMNLFDVAESYGIPNGCSEIRLGRALVGRRDAVYLVSKIGHWGARTGQAIPKTTVDMIRACGHACCGRLRTDRVDLMLCHEGEIADPSVYIAGFRALRDEGFIREYGISTDRLDVLRNFVEMSAGECAAVEVNYSLVNRAPEAEFLPYCQAQNLGVLVRGPVARGILAGKYDEQSTFTDPVRESWNAGGAGRDEFLAKLARTRAVEALVGRDALVPTALRYVISHPANPVAIPGATSPAQAAANAAAGCRVLDDADLARLRNL